MSEKPEKEKIRLSDLQNKGGKGLVCKCGCRQFRTPHTRHVPDGVLRERVCRGFGKVIHTKERPLGAPAR